MQSSELKYATGGWRLYTSYLNVNQLVLHNRAT